MKNKIIDFIRKSWVIIISFFKKTGNIFLKCMKAIFSFMKRKKKTTICLSLITLLLVGIIVFLCILFAEREKELATTNIPVNGITIVEDNNIIYLEELGEKYKLNYELSPSNAYNKNVKWKSSNENIVSVSQDGVIKLEKFKTEVDEDVLITVETIDGGYKDSIFVVVPVYEEYDLLLNDYLNSLKVTVGKEEQLLFKGLKLILSDKIHVDNILENLNVNLVNFEFVWNVSNNDVININSNIVNGEAEITCQSIGKSQVTLGIYNDNKLICEKEFSVEVVFEDVYEVICTNLKESYYQGEMIDNESIMLTIYYRNSRGQYLEKSINYLSVFEALETTQSGEIKEKLTYNGCEFIIEYNVIETILNDFKVENLLENYLVYATVNPIVKILLNENIELSYNISQMNSNIKEIDLSTPGEKVLVISYLGKEYQYRFNVLEKEIVEKSISGILNQYPVGSKIDYDNIIIDIKYNHENNLSDCYYQNVNGKITDFISVTELEELFDNSVIGKKSFKISISEYREEFLIEYDVVPGIINVKELIFNIPIKEKYNLNEELLLNVQAVYDGFTLNDNVVDNLLIYVNGVIVDQNSITNKIGEYKLKFVYGNITKEYNIKVVGGYTVNYFDDFGNLLFKENGIVDIYQEQSVKLFTYEGYEFDYLSTDDNCISSVVDNKLHFTSLEKENDIIINVYLKKATFKIIYNIANYPVYIENYLYQDLVEEYVPEEIEGYVFTGWNRDIPKIMPGYDIVVYGSYVDEKSGLYSVKFYIEDFTGNFVLEEIENCIITSGIGASFVVEYDNLINIKIIDSNNNIQKEVVKEYKGYEYLNYQIDENICSVYYSINSYTITYNYDNQTYTQSYKYNQKINQFNPVKFGYTLTWDKQVPDYMPNNDLVINGSYTANTYKVTLINNGQIVYYLYECDQELVLPLLTDEVNEFLGWQDENGTSYTHMPWFDIVLMPVWKEYVKIDSFEIIGLDSYYLINSVIDIDSIKVSFSLHNGKEETVNLKDVLEEGSFDTTATGVKELKIKYQNQTFSIYFEVTNEEKEIVSVEIEKFPSFFYEGEEISLSNYSLKIVYNNSVETIKLNSSKVVVSGFDLSEEGNKTLLITYYSEVIAIPYLVINPISIAEENVLILENEYSFYVNVDEANAPSGYVLQVSETSDYTITTINRGNGIYFVTVKLNDGAKNAKVNIAIGGTSCVKEVFISKIALDDLQVVIDGTSYGIVNKPLSVTAVAYYNNNKYNMNNVVYEWLVDKNANISSNNNYCQIIASDVGIIKIAVKVYVGEEYKTFYKEVEIISPYEGLRIVENKEYGIGEVLTLGGFRYKNGSGLTELISKIYNFNVISKTEVDYNDLVWYSSDENIAAFGLNGELNIHGTGYVTLYVTSDAAYKYGLTSSNYIGSFTVRCIYDAVFVSTYEELAKAFKDNYQVVLGNNIDVGNKVMSLTKDSNGNVTRTKLDNVNVKSLVEASVSKIVSTWETDYLKNISTKANFEPTVNYCLEITNNLYGNGYTLDCYQITTASSIDSSIKVFNGPLELISLIDAAAVYGQDNIGFLVRDNVTVDNVILQNCDDGYLYNNGLYVYSNLEKVGTTVEVMGDNVSIINSRIRNGRNTLRIFGSENVDEVIDVRVESCIIANAREFLVKIGANKSIDSNCKLTYNGELVEVKDMYEKLGMTNKQVSDYIYSDMKIYNQLYSSCSPTLMKGETKYKPRDNDNQFDEYFANTYVKTNVTMKNCVLVNTGFYAIGMESKFSGPILGGFRYAPRGLNLSYPGAYNISGTSYAALLRLEGDVRIYNWKKIDEIDSSSIMQKLPNADMIENMGFDFTFRVNELIRNVSTEEGYEKIITDISGTEYAHGGIAFFGGGKNYHMINFDNYTGSEYTRYQISFSSLEDGLFSQTLPWAAGNAPFVFYMYDSDSEFSYQYQQNEIQSGNAYNWITPAL